MSEYGTTEIQTMLKLEWKGICIQTIRISDIRAFGTTPQLSKIQTGLPHHNTTFKCYYYALQGDGGQDLKNSI